MINVNLDIKNKVRETYKDEKNKKISLKIIEDFNYKLDKKSIAKDIESIKGSKILK